ncbi:hypothetical protein [Carboxylicivirga sp. RSCT41]|uniref:hypothetical protein n=1 Tax=Carboxylicivirga agarovorans TaxID=3417570 RepID=UPI003D33C066
MKRFKKKKGSAGKKCTNEAHYYNVRDSVTSVSGVEVYRCNCADNYHGVKVNDLRAGAVRNHKKDLEEAFEKELEFIEQDVNYTNEWFSDGFCL